MTYDDDDSYEEEPILYFELIRALQAEDRVNVTCSTWTKLDPYMFLASHPTRQAEFFISIEGTVLDFACRHCERVIREFEL